MIPLPGMVWLASMGVVFAIARWFCIFRTEKMVAMARANYTRSKFIRKYPFSNFVLKDSYPTYLRSAGVFVWIWLIAVLALLL